MVKSCYWGEDPQFILHKRERWTRDENEDPFEFSIMHAFTKNGDYRTLVEDMRDRDDAEMILSALEDYCVRQVAAAAADE